MSVADLPTDWSEIPAAVADACLDALMVQNTWVHRRKGTVELTSFQIARRRLTLDLQVPEFCPSVQGGTDVMDCHLVPIALIRKAPGVFTRFDFSSDTQPSLRLPSRAQNSALSAAVLVAQARRVLATDAINDIDLQDELEFIAVADSDEALGIVKHRWAQIRNTTPRSPNEESVRGLLARDDSFWWLLRALAHSSLITAALHGKVGSRHLVKLSYDEHAEDWVNREPSLVKRLQRSFRKLVGWSGYHFISSDKYVGGGSYHFEFHAPEGAQIVQASFAGEEPLQDNPERAHLYLPDAREKRSIDTLVQLRIGGQGFITSAAFTSIMTAIVLLGAVALAPTLADGIGSVPSLLLLFPGLAATYVARPEHPLVARHLTAARTFLIITAIVSYVVAGRLALISSGHPADVCDLRLFLAAAALIALLCATAITAAVFLPRPHGKEPKNADRR